MSVHELWRIMNDSLAEHTARRAALIAQLQADTGIDEAMIERLVRHFYQQVRADGLLGPIFAAKIVDWEPHLLRMCRFWSSVVLMSGQYAGSPMQKHLPLQIEARHFDRWLELFAASARAVCSPAAASHFQERAARIAQSLEMGIANAHGLLLTKGQRFERA